VVRGCGRAGKCAQLFDAAEANSKSLVETARDGPRFGNSQFRAKDQRANIRGIGVAVSDEPVEKLAPPLPTQGTAQCNMRLLVKSRTGELADSRCSRQESATQFLRVGLTLVIWPLRGSGPNQQQMFAVPRSGAPAGQPCGSSHESSPSSA
jgi:hypothetical protein